VLIDTPLFSIDKHLKSNEKGILLLTCTPLLFPLNSANSLANQELIELTGTHVAD
jgi:hypothetical protein